MRMRLKAARGARVRNLVNNEMYTVLDYSSETVKALRENGKIVVIYKSELDLPVIDTGDYEKF